nr:cytochrome c-type biogenesis protein [Marivivens donghaensis]
MDVEAVDAEAREVYLSGNPQQEVVDYIVARYGEFVLLQPTTQGANLVLWIAPLVMLILALGVGIVTIRNKPAAKPDALSDEEKKRLEEILGS